MALFTQEELEELRRADEEIDEEFNAERREESRRFRENNREKTKQYNREYYAKNRERIHAQRLARRKEKQNES